MSAAMPTTTPVPAASAHALDPVVLLSQSSTPSLLILWALLLATLVTGLVIVVKLRQVARWRAAHHRLLRELRTVVSSRDCMDLVRRHPDALGGPILGTLVNTRAIPEMLEPVMMRELGEQRRRVFTLMTVLSTVGSVAPFVGLLGTVYGILEAFLRIGQLGSATLPVVAPAIGEALVATAMGLLAAIPAVIGYNAIGRRMNDLLDGLHEAARVWVVQVTRLDDR